MRYTLLALLGATWAFAEEPPVIVEPPPPVLEQPEPCPVPTAQPPTIAPALPVSQRQVPVAAPANARRQHNRWFEPRESAISFGVGVADFVGSSMQSATETGAEWDARYTIGQRSFVAFEAGYQGTYNKMQSPVEGDGSVAPYVINNSVDGDLRLNLLPYRVQPYVFGGVGYNHASVKNLEDSPAMAARFNDSADQLLVPAGGGLALHIFDHASIDTRATYRAVFKNGIDRTTDARMDQWAVSGRVGYAF